MNTIPLAVGIKKNCKKLDELTCRLNNQNNWKKTASEKNDQSFLNSQRQKSLFMKITREILPTLELYFRVIY